MFGVKRAAFKTQKKIIFLTEAGNKTGYGHLTRCSSLIKEFNKLGYLTKLCVEPDNIKNILTRGAHRTKWKTQIQSRLKTELKSAFGLIIDSFKISYQQIKQIVEINPKVAFIDDWNRRFYKEGIVIDWTIGAEHFAYHKKSPKTFYLLGKKYCAIRGELLPQHKKFIRKKIVSIILIFGGSDVQKITEKISYTLQRFYPKIRQFVVFGPGVDQKTVAKFRKKKGKRTCIYYKVSPSKLRKLMKLSDLAISGGGQTLYELSFFGVPTLCIQTCKNQRHDICGFHKKKAIFYLGKSNKKDIFSNIILNTEQLLEKKVRKKLSINAQKLVDGYGAKRIVKFCEKTWSLND